MPEADDRGCACAAPAIEGARFCPMCGTALGTTALGTTAPGATAGDGEESRRNVVILFIDLVGSTALAESLDPEPLRTVMDRYYAVCADAIRRHGGTIEKFIGDAVMAAFGVPRSHEDDALRAVRAAEAARRGVRELGAEVARTRGVELDVHIGVGSGEVVVTAASDGDLRVVGDAVNTAARLQSAAAAGETLLGPEVASMVRAHTRLEQLPAIPLRGKAEPVPVWRLLSVEDAPRERAAGAVPMIGRDRELDLLRRGFGRTVRDGRCRLVTVLGEPGLGKSRLVREFLAEAGHGATVLVGHCRSYGRGITYLPVAEMIRSLPGGWDRTVAELRNEPGGPRALRTLAAVTGAEAGGPAAVVGVEEISWAVRRLFEVLGSRRPLVAVWENVQWAEPTLLELIDDLAGRLREVPVLMLCVARPELLEARPTWGEDRRPDASVIELDRLAADRTGELVDALLRASDAPGAAAVRAEPEPSRRRADHAGVRHAVVAGCEGNPLFAELIFDIVVENGPDAALPPSIRAVLGARLDSLPHPERRLLEWAATIGWEFTHGELAVLAAVDGSPLDIEALLPRVERRRLVQRGDGPDTYRFGQVLVRDTAYARTAKARRGRWHSGLAAWLGGDGASPAADARPDGRLGHHAEMACLLRREVDPDDPDLPGLATRAARLLTDEGTVALRRKDLPAAAALLERAQNLLPAAATEHPMLALLLADCRLGLGEPDKALATLDAGARAATPEGGRVIALQRQLLELRFGTLSRERAAAATEDRADGFLDARTGDLHWYVLHQFRAFLRLGEARLGDAEDSLRAALSRARSLGDAYAENRILIGLCELTQWSPTPVEQGLALCAELLERFAADRSLVLSVLATKGRLLALAGASDEAAEVLATARHHAEDLHLRLGAAAVSQAQGLAASLAGRHGLAQEHFRSGAEELSAAGHPGPARTLTAYRAREAFRCGQPDLAAEQLAVLAADSEALDLRTELITAALQARLAAAAGRREEVLARAAAVVPLSGRTDDLCLRGDTLAELAEALFTVGEPADAERMVRSAVRCYRAKGAESPALRLLARSASASTDGQVPA
ncbi:ATP-binding protein [Kitasatospora cineracea]|uniref:ATP-binding protein n=1 Tax=Kitasatospora cineracea TaxID=88074 RepID=UPI003807D539